MMRALPLIAAALLAGTAAAEEPGSRQTREFVNAAAQSDQFEIWEARVALTTSSDPRVRDFAQQMLDAHRGTAQALKQATAQAGLKPPPEAMSSDQALLLGALQGMSSGPEFDKAYWTHQAVAHRGALVVARGYADTGDTPPLKQAAAEAAPMIAHHLRMAEEMKAKTGGEQGLPGRLSRQASDGAAT